MLSIFELKTKKNKLLYKKEDVNESIAWICDVRRKSNSIFLKIFLGSIVIGIPVLLYFLCLIPKIIPIDLIMKMAFLGAGGFLVSGSELILSNLLFAVTKKIVEIYGNSLDNSLKKVEKELSNLNSKIKVESNLKDNSNKNSYNLNSKKNKYSYNKNNNKQKVSEVQIIDGKVYFNFSDGKNKTKIKKK